MMDLHIFGLFDAITFEPVKPTYAIRLISGKCYSEERKPLFDSTLYRAIRFYQFDDITPRAGRGILFTEAMARDILLDFTTQRSGIEALVVHCFFGKNRSPAVAMALNEIYGLGHDTDALKKKYNEANWYVYNLLKKTASG
jgi:predicted protein tyrosine phosphatase